MDGTKTTTNWIIAGLVALVVIIGGGWLIARERAGVNMAGVATSTETVSTTSGAPSADTETDTETETPSVSEDDAPPTRPGTVATETSSASGETVSVIDQPAGASVMVADVNIKKPSWVAVRDTRGWYPGATWLVGSQTNVTVPLLRNTEAGKTYEVVIFIDDGDKQFEIHGGDTLVVSTQGVPVSSTFTAQ